MPPIQTFPGYHQLIDLMKERILTRQYPEDERVPSVRDLAIEMEVNPITVTRAYERLQRAGLIHTQRGLGYFVTPGAPELIRAERMERFYQEMLPSVEREMRMLEITPEDVCHYFREQVQRANPQTPINQ